MTYDNWKSTDTTDYGQVFDEHALCCEVCGEQTAAEDCEPIEVDGELRMVCDVCLPTVAPS